MPVKRASGGPTVVLVGRPNVGKSTLSNRITGTRKAIVTAIAGTTRDVNSQPAEWQNVTFTLTDTGGMFGASQDPLHALVFAQGLRAVETADVIVFVVDGEGLVPADEEIATSLRSANVPVIVAVNKTDDRQARGRAVEFYTMGFEPVVEIAAEHGEGTGDLLDEVIARLPTRRAPPGRRSPATAVAIIGRPNVGKSSLLNRILRGTIHRQRCAQATRDTVNALLTWRKRTFRIVDTAGIRRLGRSRDPGRSRRSACWWRGGRSNRPTWRCWCWTPSRGPRIRTRRSWARRKRRGAASSWSRTSGI
jgi:GTP-binding protein